LKKSILHILLLLPISIVWAQPSIKIPKVSHDFGTIEEGTQASYTFDVHNTGSKPLIISNVQPSCGCTTPEWTKDPIQPGGKGKIMATFNSQGRLGAFNKEVSVISNDAESTKTLTIKGFVEKKNDSKIRSTEEIRLSPILYMERSIYNFGKMEVEQKIHQKVKISNKGITNLKFNGIQAGCYCVNYNIAKQEIAPGETVELELIYSPQSLGEQMDIVTLSTNDIVTKKPIITLQANVVESFSNIGIMNQGTRSVPFK
jgi:hypothetical protein